MTTFLSLLQHVSSTSDSYFPFQYLALRTNQDSPLPTPMDGEKEDTQRQMDGSPNERPPNSPREKILNMQEMPSERQANCLDQVHASIAHATGQLRELVTIMGQSALAKDSKTSLRRLLKQVIKLTKFEYPETRTVGFIGTTGVGLFSLVILSAKKKAASSFVNRKKLGHQFDPWRNWSCALRNLPDLSI